MTGNITLPGAILMTLMSPATHAAITHNSTPATPPTSTRRRRALTTLKSLIVRAIDRIERARRSLTPGPTVPERRLDTFVSTVPKPHNHYIS